MAVRMQVSFSRIAGRGASAIPILHEQFFAGRRLAAGQVSGRNCRFVNASKSKGSSRAGHTRLCRRLHRPARSCGAVRTAAAQCRGISQQMQRGQYAASFFVKLSTEPPLKTTNHAPTGWVLTVVADQWRVPTPFGRKTVWSNARASATAPRGVQVHDPLQLHDRGQPPVAVTRETAYHPRERVRPVVHAVVERAEEVRKRRPVRGYACDL